MGRYIYIYIYKESHTNVPRQRGQRQQFRFTVKCIQDVQIASLPGMSSNHRDMEKSTEASETVGQSVEETKAEHVHNEEPPNGGLAAWLTVCAVWLAAFASLGLSQSWGVFQEAFLSNQYSQAYQGLSSLRLGFLGGCSVGFAFICGPFSNMIITALGVRNCIGLGFFLMVFSLMMASISRHFWSLLLSQGILFG